MSARCLVLLCLACAASASLAQQRVVAVVGAHIIPISGPEIPDGVLVAQGGRITALGPRATTPVPKGARRVAAQHLVLLPGLVDTHSHIGNPSGGDRSGPLQPQARVLDAFDARAPSVGKARAGGITTVNVLPGSGLLMSGQSIYIKLRAGTRVEELLIKNPDGSPAGGLKMANGTNPQGKPPFPGTRAKEAALVRKLFIQARAYQEKIRRAAGDPAQLPERNLKLEAVVEALEGRRIVHFHTHRSDDILTVLRLKREFGFRVVLHHVSEGFQVAREIAAAKVPCSVIVLDAPGGKLEARAVSFKTGAVLDAAGVLVAFHTDDPITDSRLFLRSAALAVRAGMPRQKALLALTLAGARMLDLDQRVGSLDVGKDADFILLSGDPFSLYTRVLQTWVEGKKVFDLHRKRDHLLATGGFGAGNPLGTAGRSEQEAR